MPLIPDELDHHYSWLANANPYIITYLFDLGLPVELTGPGHLYHSPFGCTNGVKVYLNRQWVLEQAALEHGCFAIAHEVAHAIFRHDLLLRQWMEAGHVLGRPFVMETAQHALDYVVNNMLHRSGMGAAMPGWCYHEPAFITCLDSEDEAYAKLFDRNPPAPLSGSPSSGSPASGSSPAKPGEGGADVLPAPDGALPGEDTPIPASRRLAAAAKAIREIGEAAFDRGYSPGGLTELLHRLDPRTLDWRSLIRRTIRAAAGNDKVSWHNLRARSYTTGVALPRKKGMQAGTVVIQTDTSGSVSTAELEYFAGAVVSVCRQVMPKRLIVLHVDAAVHKVFEVNSPQELRRAMTSGTIHEVAGRGGTDMCVGFRWCKDNGVSPDALITLTDGETGFPADFSPAKDALWVVTRPKARVPEHAGRSVYADLG